MYLNILEMYLCLFLPSKFLSIQFIFIIYIFCIVDADEFRLLLMPTSNNTSSIALTTSHTLDTRLLPPMPIEATPKYMS